MFASDICRPSSPLPDPADVIMVLLRHDYSWSEHALGFWCPLMLLMLSVTSLGLRYVTSPAVCFTPAQFTYAHITYVQEMCFQKTYQYSGMQVSFSSGRLVDGRRE